MRYKTLALPATSSKSMSDPQTPGQFCYIQQTASPQLAHPFDFWNTIQYYADNRKSFDAATFNNKFLLIYRRLQTSRASIAVYNETDNTTTNIRTETWAGAANQGVPYSMDFAIDLQSDGIYVYTFVVRYIVTGSTFSSATLKIFRRRVEPLASETRDI